MKLYVDDLRKPPEGWEPARTITEAIRALATGLVEEISLDHDIIIPEYLGNSKKARSIVANFSAETFEPVARYLAMMLIQPRVRFHTGNITAGENMARIIGCPFVHDMHESFDA